MLLFSLSLLRLGESVTLHREETGEVESQAMAVLRAWSRSAIRSSTSSIPTLTLIKFGVMPCSSRTASGMFCWHRAASVTEEKRMTKRNRTNAVSHLRGQLGQGFDAAEGLGEVDELQ